MDEQTTATTKKKKSKNRAVRIVILIVLILIIIACAAILASYYFGTSRGEKGYDDLLIGVQTNIEENPIDFDALTAENDEIYAWIKIDDTEVDYPIAQSKTDDEFYLKHSAATREYLSSGAIYTEVCNATDFSDPITVIYGHNGYGTTMFTTLHNFEDEEFFNEHEYYTIYLDGRKLTYQIISAFQYDDRHIMNTFDFSSIETLLSFQITLQHPNSEVENVRENLDVPINEDSNIVILSTCTSNNKSVRYLISSVLVKDEITV